MQKKHDISSNIISVSVLICTYNRHELLAKCLHALIECSSDKPDQIVIVNGGDEQADIVVHEYSKLYVHYSISIKLVKTVNKNLAASRNIGLPHCTGDIIAMTDDDAEVYPDWIQKMKQLHQKHQEAGAIGGAIIGAVSSSFVSRLADQVTFASYPTSREVRTLPGVNISYKREITMCVGPQDEELFRGEDVDYNWRIIQLGKTIYYDPSMKVLHHHRPTLYRFFQQHYMYGRAYYLVRRKHMNMYCVYPHSFRRVRDFIKAIHFIVAAFYEPFIYAFRIKGLALQIGAVPVLFINQCFWRSGMIVERLKTIIK